MAEELSPVDRRSLVVDHLTIRYYGREVDALRELSLEVDAGELVGVAGRNGSGKSTLALATAGFIPRVVRAKVAGSVTIAGEPLVDSSTGHAGAGGATAARRHRVGIVFPNPANQLSATKVSVREELAFGLENLGIPRAEMEQRIDAVLSRLGIEHLADRPPFALSGGEQQRVAIGSIVAMGMGVLVLDEPTAQLDPLSTEAVGTLLTDLAAGGTAILVAEHASTVLGRTIRCLVLDDGRAVTVDVPGSALGSRTLEPLGLHPPTVVALAELAGVDPGMAWDEATIAAALERRFVRQDGRPPTNRPTDRAPDRVQSWTPVREQQVAGVELRGLTHRYAGGIEALRGVDLRIEPGETVAIVGQNGSGKTTLVKHLNGLLRPTAGSVAIGGRDTGAERIDELASLVGFVFQNPDDQLFNRTVEREVAFGPRNLRLGDAQAARLVDQAIEAAGLQAERTANPYDLNVSGRKLVALASVLAMDPAVLVLDEPTTGQDGPGVDRIGAVVEALQQAGRTVVAITHDMEFAAARFDRIIVMRLGEIIDDGPPVAVFASENHDRLASTGLAPPATARISSRLGLDPFIIDPAELRSLVGA